MSSDRARTHDFNNGYNRFYIVSAHHTHDDIACCACGDTWPCIPAMRLQDQLNAFSNEYRGRFLAEHGPEVRKLVELIEGCIGERYTLYMVNVGYIS